ncbi:MAG: electron transfer flavoprotein subunit alpha/FixB family protein, partial [Eggerthellaceae bacterium]|nr:electron transfer flavoprotein subunit alpha/FixB family protein [Eggerthellaceae bacterium]
MKAFVIAEHADAASALAAGARTLADEVAVAVIGDEAVPANIADAAYHVAVPADAVADDADATLAPVVEGADVVLAEPTRHVKSVVGKLAAAAGASVITDALSIEDGVATEMYFGGVGQVKRQAKTACAFYTAGAGAFGDAQPSGANAAAEELAWVAPANAVKRISSSPIQKSGVDLTKSDAIVAAGRGFAEEADLGLAHDFADKLGAGQGCSRPLAEGVNWMPTETDNGVSGLRLSPKVYVGVGISGQLQ